MTKNNFQKSATRGTKSKGSVGLGNEQSVNNQIIVYDNFSGMPIQVTFLGGKWWVTSPAEWLVPLDKYIQGDDYGYSFACEDHGTVGAMVLAKILGKALQQPELNIDETLRHRVADLRRLGVTLDVKDETLKLEYKFFSNKGTQRQGKYSVLCDEASNPFVTFFDIDGFDEAEVAELWATTYFDYLKELGVEFSVKRINKV